MDITPSNLSALYTKYSQLFQAAFLQQEILWNKVAQLVPSTSESETHVWMDRIPQLRKWVGDRIIRNALIESLNKLGSSIVYCEDIMEEFLQDGTVGGINIDDAAEAIINHEYKNAFQPTLPSGGEEWPNS